MKLFQAFLKVPGYGYWQKQGNNMPFISGDGKARLIRSFFIVNWWDFLNYFIKRFFNSAGHFIHFTVGLFGSVNQFFIRIITNIHKPDVVILPVETAKNPHQVELVKINPRVVAAP